jgi:hypothetical protein
MKKYLLFSALISAILLASCEPEQIAVDNTTNNSTVIPSAVRLAVSNNFPQAAQVSYSTLSQNTTYGVDLKVNGKSIELTITANGTVLSSFSLSDDTTKVSLPANVTTYLNTNYAGYKLERVAAGKDKDGNTLYKVLIEWNDQKVTVVFDANGAFVAEFKEPKRVGQVKGKFRKFYTVTYDQLPATIQTQLTGYTFVRAAANADSTGNKFYFVLAKKDSVFYEFSYDNAGKLLTTKTYAPNIRKIEDKSLKQSELPANIATYLNANYASWKYEKGIKIIKNEAVDSYYISLSIDKKLVFLTFDASGNLTKTVSGELKLPKFEDVKLTADVLPATITSYLNTTYSGWSLDKAIAFKIDGVIESYYLHIVVGTSKYHLYFDKDGKFLVAKIDK